MMIRSLRAPLLCLSFVGALSLLTFGWAAAPAELAFELDVKVAYNGEDVLWLFSWPTERPNFHHDMLVFENGAWVRKNNNDVVRDEDRVTIMVDNGTVTGFANLGCYATCHAGMNSLDTMIGRAEVNADPVFGLRGVNDIRKYIADSRSGANWFDSTWNAVLPDAMLENLRDTGVFLDLWHWRAARSNPIGFNDDQFVLDYRLNDGTRGPNTSNVNADTGAPRLMFDPAKVGFTNLDYAYMADPGYSQTEDVYYLSTDNSIEFDPNLDWQEGDAIPRFVLREPAGSQGDTLADGRWVDGRWTVELRRAMDSGSPTTDHAIELGRVYTVGFGVFRDGAGARFHHVSLPIKVGFGTPGPQITAAGFLGDEPDWDAIAWTSVPVYYPAQVTMEWLLSEEHAGWYEMRADTASCASCHGDTLRDLRNLSEGSIDATGE